MSSLHRSASSQMPGERVRVGNVECDIEEVCKCEIIGTFRLGKVIGEGSFGKVMLATDIRTKSKVSGVKKKGDLFSII